MLAGAKHNFLFGFLDKARAAFERLEDVTLLECVRCGQVTTSTVCAFCKLADQVKRAAGAGPPARPIALPLRACLELAAAMAIVGSSIVVGKVAVARLPVFLLSGLRSRWLVDSRDPRPPRRSGRCRGRPGATSRCWPSRRSRASSHSTCCCSTG